MKDIKMQVKAKHAIEYEERTECREILSRTQMEHPKAEDKQHLQEVFNSKVQSRTSFNFVNIHLMLHYQESVQCFGHLVKDSTQMEEMNHRKIVMAPYRWPNHNFWHTRRIPKDYSHINVLRMWRLHFRPLAKEGHSTPEIQEQLLLHQPKDQIVLNKFHREPVLTPENLPLSFCKNEGHPQVRGLQSPRRKGFLVRNECLPMYNVPLVAYQY